jgi:ribosomal protein S18 acetylase RimI-like enzyme
MELRHVRPSEVPAVFNLLMENGWERRITDLAEFVALVAASPIAEVAVVDGVVVGFVRGITDGLSNGYLSMVVVASTHRGRGVGTALVQHAIGDHPRITWVLRAGRDGANEFFAKLGFRVSSIAMERLRA